jgi:hypothetical protein
LLTTWLMAVIRQSKTSEPSAIPAAESKISSPIGKRMKL